MVVPMKIIIMHAATFHRVMFVKICQNTSLAVPGHSLTACNATPLETPHCMPNPKWLTWSGNRSYPRL